MAAGSWKSCPVAAMVRMILVVVAMVASSSMAVMAEDGQTPVCKLNSRDVADVVHSIVNPKNATAQECKKVVSKVKTMGDDCLCEFMRVVQARFERPVELSSSCISPGDMPTCPPACIITQATVDRFVKEINSAGVDFRESALCKDTVSEVTKVGDDCFCQLRSRVQKKVEFSIDDALCATPATLSRCPRTGKEPTCSVQDDDVQYCVKALVPGHGLVQELVGVVEDVVDVVTGDEPPSVAGCCSKVKAQGRACACEFRRAIEQQLIASNGDLASLDAMRPCLGDAGGDDGECPAAPPVEEQPAGCRITERDVFAVAEKVRIYNVYTDDLCNDAVSRVRRTMGEACLCELRDRAQTLFDDMDVGRWWCIRPSDTPSCAKPSCVIKDATVDYVARLVDNQNNAETALICSDAAGSVWRMGEECFCELIGRVQARFDYTIVDYMCIDPENPPRCAAAAAAAGPCGFSKGDVGFIVEAIRSKSESKLGVVCSSTMPRLALGLPRDDASVWSDEEALPTAMAERRFSGNASADASRYACLCALRDAVQANFDTNIDRFLCQPLGYLSRCPPTKTKTPCELTDKLHRKCFDAAVVQTRSPYDLCCSNLAMMGDACACVIYAVVQRQFKPHVPGRFCVSPFVCPIIP
ncbi:hypothetical protein ACP4OV_029105 [Aristida adscensionis]